MNEHLAKSQATQDQNLSDLTHTFEVKRERQLIELIATIIVDKVLTEARERGYSIANNENNEL